MANKEHSHKFPYDTMECKCGLTWYQMIVLQQLEDDEARAKQKS